ncbi:MAG: alpha/beta hydrolase [Novosphingobium sp.]
MTEISTNQFEYVEGQMRPSHAALLDRFIGDSERAVAQGHPALDLAYGPHPRQTLDLFRAAGTRKGVVAFFHAGYWQSRDKSQFRFIAPPLASDGFDVALVNYPLCPEVTVADIVAAAAASLAAIAARTDGVPQILVGHSAGAHIAVELATKPPVGAWISGIVPISGVFELEPLIDTTLNAKLGLDRASARACSPLGRAKPGAPRALFAVGALETQAFRDQTSAMANAWSEAGNEARQVTVAGADHFSVLEELCRDEGVLRTAMSNSAWM